MWNLAENNMMQQRGGKGTYVRMSCVRARCGIRSGISAHV